MTTSDPIAEADLHAFVDGELDAAAQAKVAAWLDSHPDDAALAALYRQQNRDLRNLFDSVLDEPIPEAMRAAVHQSTPRPDWAVWTKRIAAAAFVLLVGAAGGWGLRGLQEAASTPSVPGYVHRAMGAYTVYAAEVRHPVEVPATQQDHLVAWLSKRLDHPMRVPHLDSLGYRLMGGRLLEDGGMPAAQLMYEDRGGRRVAVYVRPYKGGDTAFKFFSTGKTSAFYWIDSPLAYALAGDLPRQDLMTIAHTVYEDLAR